MSKFFVEKKVEKKLKGKTGIYIFNSSFVETRIYSSFVETRVANHIRSYSFGETRVTNGLARFVRAFVIHQSDAELFLY